jgi:hypothetical protein
MYRGILDTLGTVYYNQHVLRCAVDTKVDVTACTHNSNVGISCSITRVNPYKSQIALYTTRGQQRSPNISLIISSGMLGISFDIRKPTLVCGEGFDKSAADTACRQLGYTNANDFNSTTLQTTKQTFWDAGLNCKSQSHSYLNNCFSKTPTNHSYLLHIPGLPQL